MRKNKLDITFHNPNTEEETIRHLSMLLAEVAVTKVIKSQELNAKIQTA